MTGNILTRLERLEAEYDAARFRCPACGGTARRGGVLVRGVPVDEARAERESAPCPSCGRVPALVRCYIGVDLDVV